MASPLPANPSIEWLRSRAKERLGQLRDSDPDARLHQAQRSIANEYGFTSWRAMKVEVDRRSVDGRLVRAAQAGAAATLGSLLDEHPKKLTIEGGRWRRPLLHHAAEGGHIECVELLLARGFDVNARDRLDDATALHWAASEGHNALVRRLIEVGADPDGVGDAHKMGVIGWATCLHDTQPATADLLLELGARPTIWAAVALEREALVRSIVAADPGCLGETMSRFEQSRTPLHFAVARNSVAMVRLLLDLGADVGAFDLHGVTPLGTATPQTDPRIVEALQAAGASPTERTMNPFQHIVPIFGVTDMAETLDHYVDALGFSLEFEFGDPTQFAGVLRDDVTIYLTSYQDQSPAGVWASIWMPDVDALHDEYQVTGATILQAPTDQVWGAREMKIEDPSGNVLRMSTPIVPESG